MKYYKYISAALLSITVLSGFYGCKKSYLDTNPSDAVTDVSLFSTTTACYQVLDGIGRLMNTTGASYFQEGSTARANDWGESTVRFEEDHMGIDVVIGVNNYDWFSELYKFNGNRQPTYNLDQFSWRLYYKIINSANLLLDHVDAATGPAAEVANLKGQAYAYRAYAYYRLSCFYCRTYAIASRSPNSDSNLLGLPIYLHSTLASTKGVARSSVLDVYKVIDKDVDSAKFFLEESPSVSGRPISDISLPTFYGIAAKIALVKDDWQTASDMASSAISTFSGRLMDSASYLGGFSTNTNIEWMWGSTLSASQTTTLGNLNFFSFVDPSNSTSYANTGLTTSIAKATFDALRSIPDVRAQTFNQTSRLQTKFHLVDKSAWTYDLLYMRLSEMYLIKAEAQAQLGQEADAITTLSTLVLARNKSYDYNDVLKRYTTANSPSQQPTAYFGRTNLLKEIYFQRRIEMFLEGTAYSDIQRWQCGLTRPSGTGNFTISTAGPLKYPANSNTFLFKIPQQELDANPAMAGQQNP